MLAIASGSHNKNPLFDLYAACHMSHVYIYIYVCIQLTQAANECELIA